ncbi:MAG: glycoside hydrolase family 5 protein, partial [Acidimicrobiales bacterium]
PTTTTAAPSSSEDAAAPELPGLPVPLLDPDDPNHPPPAPGSDPSPSGHEASWAVGAPFGQYRARVEVASTEAQRVDVTVDGLLVGSYSVGTVPRTLDALIHVDGPGTRLGVRSSAPVSVGTTALEPVAPTMTTRGTSILDPTGTVRQIRGTNRNGYQLAPEGSKAFNRFGHEGEHLWRWGMDVVRLPLNQEFWLEDCAASSSWVHDSPTRPDGSSWRYRELVDEEVRRYTQRGIMVILDLHASSRGEATGCAADGHVLHEMPDVRSVAFWAGVAERYRDEPYVAFDLYNEPHLHDALEAPTEAEAERIWRDGGAVTYRDRSGLVPRTATYWTVGFQRLYDVIRETGATNLVLVAGLHYANRPGVHLTQPLDATNLGASVHMYCLRCDEVAPDDQVRYTFGEASGEEPAFGVADRHPVVMTEFGTDEWWDSSDNRRYVEVFEGRGVGWLVWTWAGGGVGDGHEPFGILAESTLHTASRAPGPSGQAIWAALAPIRAARGV